ncbi:glycosyl hydrolase family 76-domain-containing protein [Neurospora hispaniola]|uniref:Glycosyl hydrolase family 76-domain-containing protein n=1 Tax=Neurospora hispaniola TaxID=588809 RepID=A0AAJ0MMD7_9PEZI|nr:glycosyl hydrolase family 76-domain-containing protein [Neurospora hispaniola]
MVAIQWGPLAARTLFFASTHPHRHAVNENSTYPQVDNSTYAQKAQDAAMALQEWYDLPSGLWNTTGWWNGANCLTVMGDLALADPAIDEAIRIKEIFQTTFYNAQRTSATADKLLGANGKFVAMYKYETIEEEYETIGDELAGKRRSQGFPKFLNNFFDDEGWWGLALVRGWDATGDLFMLTAAQTIYDDMVVNGLDPTCGGGIWWSKDRKYKNAIANELYIALGASLANRESPRKDWYISQTVEAWNWFKQSGLINDKGLINDGLKRTDQGCVNNKMPTWSYNQGVILGGLVELSKATGDQSYLAEAVTIANAALKALQDENGIIREIDRCEPHCGDDGSQFKGVFVRNLAYLHNVAPHDNFRDAILKNADSIWAHNRNSQNQLGISWAGPAEAGKGPTAATHSSAMDVLVGALTAIKK